MNHCKQKNTCTYGSRWRVKKLTYKISKYPRSLDKASVDKDIARAFAVWSEYTDLTFTQKKSGQVHIDIRFERGEHGDGDPFDGPGGTLAHAYFPVYGGDAHFDDSEHWSINSYRGTNLFQVAAHEFGHSLGLSHSDIKAALMAPFYRDYYWKLTDDGVASGYPRLISSSWKGLPGKIDAAFTYKNGKTYFFKGSKYWRYVGKRIDGDYPKDISEGFTGIPDNIDAVTVWTGNGKIYFYKGTKFWRFDPAQRPPVKSTYPKLISNWEGVPNNMDAALTYHGYTYFFKDNAYYRFNDRTFSVDVADPAFPRATAFWWFGCKSASRGTLGNIAWKNNYLVDPSENGNSENNGGDFLSDDYDKGNDGEVMFDTGSTDELVTSSNQDSANSGAVSIFSRGFLRLAIAATALIITKTFIIT
ncbi:Similar to mmp11: Stromelysin-3 (Xenopus laevis) [Cotesia congregata]|uniref:Similar to mmp11: Stromelysin-3 (Xenopus laevis) n=1 Tax=Cotesia congregata TaxID=51543 RepID=A0A8J2HMC7_COTCN|nr:Similar to mmp11: Stromelysin-3 (Xenopus laevis) [Cotesia congregata]